MPSLVPVHNIRQSEWDSITKGGRLGAFDAPLLEQPPWSFQTILRYTPRPWG